MWAAYSVDRLSARSGGQYRRPLRRLPVQRQTLSNAIRLMPATTGSISGSSHADPCHKASRQPYPAWPTHPVATSPLPGCTLQASTPGPAGQHPQRSPRPFPASRRHHRATGPRYGSIACTSKVAQDDRPQPLSLLASTCQPPLPTQRLICWPN